jgi:hypothetical protein
MDKINEVSYIVSRTTGQFAEVPCHSVHGIDLEVWTSISVELPLEVPISVHPDGVIETKEDYFRLMMVDGERVEFISIPAVEIEKPRGWKSRGEKDIYYVKSTRFGLKYKCKFCGRENLGYGAASHMHWRGCIKRSDADLTEDKDEGRSKVKRGVEEQK